MERGRDKNVHAVNSECRMWHDSIQNSQNTGTCRKTDGHLNVSFENLLNLRTIKLQSIKLHNVGAGASFRTHTPKPPHHPQHAHANTHTPIMSGYVRVSEHIHIHNLKELFAAYHVWVRAKQN